MKYGEKRNAVPFSNGAGTGVPPLPERDFRLPYADNGAGTGVLPLPEPEFRLPYAEFLPALMIPKEQRITNLPKLSRSGLSIPFSSISRTRVMAYC